MTIPVFNKLKKNSCWPMVRKRNLANNRDIETIDVMTNTNIRIYGYNNNMCQRIFVKNIEN